jgi:hypothetical protein
LPILLFTENGDMSVAKYQKKGKTGTKETKKEATKVPDIQTYKKFM